MTPSIVDRTPQLWGREATHREALEYDSARGLFLSAVLIFIGVFSVAVAAGLVTQAPGLVLCAALLAPFPLYVIAVTYAAWKKIRRVIRERQASGGQIDAWGNTLRSTVTPHPLAPLHPEP